MEHVAMTGQLPAKTNQPAPPAQRLVPATLGQSASSGAIQLRSISDVASFAETAYNSGMMGDTLKSVSQAKMKLYAGLELGLTPIDALNNVVFVKGQTRVMARGILAALARHPRYDFECLEWTDELCTVQIMRDGKPKGVPVTFTLAQAKAHGLMGGKVWLADTRQQLLYKAIARAQAVFAADLFGMPIRAVEDVDDSETVVENTSRRGGRKTQDVQIQEPVSIPSANLAGLDTEQAEDAVFYVEEDGQEQSVPERAAPPPEQVEAAGPASDTMEPQDLGEPADPGDESPLHQSDLPALMKIARENGWDNARVIGLISKKFNIPGSKALDMTRRQYNEVWAITTSMTPDDFNKSAK
jgi:hypothetical protein